MMTYLIAFAVSVLLALTVVCVAAVVGWWLGGVFARRSP